MHVIIGSRVIGVSNGLKFEVDLPSPSGTVSVHSRFLIFCVFFVRVFIATYTYWEADAATRVAVWPDSPEICWRRREVNVSFK